MAGAIGASLLIVAALAVATVSALSSAGVVSSPFGAATNASSSSEPVVVWQPGPPLPQPQEQRCPCP